MKEPNQTRSKDTLLSLIVAFKFLKGALLIAVALGAHHLINHDAGEFAERLVDSFRVDPNNEYFEALVEKLQWMSPEKLKTLSIGGFFYAALILTEGTGLALRKPWGEYLTILVTGSFLPLEIYELARGVTVLKVLVLAINWQC